MQKMGEDLSSQRGKQANGARNSHVSSPHDAGSARSLELTQERGPRCPDLAPTWKQAALAPERSSQRPVKYTHAPHGARAQGRSPRGHAGRRKQENGPTHTQRGAEAAGAARAGAAELAGGGSNRRPRERRAAQCGSAPARGAAGCGAAWVVPPPAGGVRRRTLQPRRLRGVGTAGGLGPPASPQPCEQCTSQGSEGVYGITAEQRQKSFAEA